MGVPQKEFVLIDKPEKVIEYGLLFFGNLALIIGGISTIIFNFWKFSRVTKIVDNQSSDNREFKKEINVKASSQDKKISDLTDDVLSLKLQIPEQFQLNHKQNRDDFMLKTQVEKLFADEKEDRKAMLVQFERWHTDYKDQLNKIESVVTHDRDNTIIDQKKRLADNQKQINELLIRINSK